MFDPIKHIDSRSLYAQDAIIYTALNLIADSKSLHVKTRLKESICAKHALRVLFHSYFKQNLAHKVMIKCIILRGNQILKN